MNLRRSSDCLRFIMGFLYSYDGFVLVNRNPESAAVYGRPRSQLTRGDVTGITSYLYNCDLAQPDS